MEKILMFYMPGCPYCAQAERVLKDLYRENPAYQKIGIQRVDETREVAFANSFDYYYVPTMYIDGKKLYEACPGETHEMCKKQVRAVLEAAL